MARLKRGIAGAPRALAVAVASGALLAAAPCGTLPQPAQAGPALLIVATSSIVADWAREVGGERVEVFSLVPPGGDPHSFQPGARAIARVAEADLILATGLGLEASWMDDLVRNAAADRSRVVRLGDSVGPLVFAGTGGQAVPDPHFWLDPLRVGLAVDEIATRLSALDPEGGTSYRENAAVYRYRLGVLHAWVQEQVATIPPDRRILVTGHDSFRYFAALYGYRVVGSVTPGVTTEREASAEELARLVDAIREHGAPAVFVEASMDDRLARSVADDTGARVVGSLLGGSLGPPGSDADTYIGMMRADVRTIVEALK